MKRTCESLFLELIKNDFPLLYSNCLKETNMIWTSNEREKTAFIINHIAKISLYYEINSRKYLTSSSRKNIKKYIKKLKKHIYDNPNILFFHEL